MTTNLAVWSGSLVVMGLFAFGAAAARVEAADQAGQLAPNGATLFHTYCASCHGTTARGDGPLADSMRHRPPDLTGILMRHKGVFPGEKVYRIIDGREPVRGHGGPDMPVWGDAFLRSGERPTEQKVRARIQSLVDFLKSIQSRNTE